MGEGLLTIDDTAFEEDDFTEVILPNSVQTIGSYAFESDSLQRVTIGTDVTSIATRAFAQLNNGSLTTVNYNAKNCTTIGSDAFNNGPITTVTIGEDVESIPTGLFNYTNDGTNRDGSTYNYGFHIQTVNYNAKNCTQPCTRTENYDENGLKYYTYSDFPFENSSSTIKTVTIGDSVESIPGYLFHNCTALETVHFNAAHCHQAGDSVVYKNYYADQNSSVKAMAKARSLAATADMQGEWYVPQSVAAAADPATTQLLSASSKRKIIAYAGEEDDGDDEKDYENEEDYRDGRDIYTPYSDAIIYYPVFGGCTKLKTLDMGKHVHRVPEALCYNASSLSDLTIGDSVVYIGRVAFNGCGLTTLTIPEGVEDMEDNVFENNTSLTTVNYYARNCNLAGHFDYDDTEENTNYWFTTFSGCSNLTTFNVENTVDTIPNVLCLCVSSLVNLDLGTNVKKIYRGAFEKCSSLPSVTFPSSLKVLGINSFRDDSTLVAVTIPATIDSIYAGAFESCVKLATVYAPAAPPYCESTAFYEIADDSWLVVPEDYACAYTTDDKFQATKATKTGWNDIDNLREDKVSLTPLSANDYYTTCYSPYEYTLDPGVKGAIIQSVTESDSQSYTDDNVTEYTLTISWDYDGDDDSKNVVPAGTALLIKGTAETTYADSTRNATETKVTGNLMGGSTKLNSDDSTVTTTAGDGNSDSDYYFYRLTYGNKSPFDALLGFYRMDTDGSPFNITKKKAWLAIPKSQIDVSGANLPLISFVESDGSDSDVNLEIGIDSDGETTGISSLASEGVAGAVIYNMAGQRVNDMNRKGIYIISGKKVIKK
ncbi:MAG: leucine-rich repeat domain-containing protein [Prevotella sp.]|nr:leucine-rich repeat domain-containing protein [Prevotella sp.]